MKIGKHNTVCKSMKVFIKKLKKSDKIKKVVLGNARNIKTRSTFDNDILSIVKITSGYKIVVVTENGCRDVFVICKCDLQELITIIN